MTATPAWLAVVEALLNRGIGASSQAAALARSLEATAVRVVIEGLTTIRIGACGGQVALTAATNGVSELASAPVNATITGSPFALLALARSGGTANRSPASTSARLSGDAEIANSYRHLLALAKPDWEEELSRVVGDLPARRLFQWAQHTAAWARQVRRTARENVAEYLQEESRDLVSKPEVDEFLQGVDALREAADRVAARLERLERRAQGVA